MSDRAEPGDVCRDDGTQEENVKKNVTVGGTPEAEGELRSRPPIATEDSPMTVGGAAVVEGAVLSGTITDEPDTNQHTTSNPQQPTAADISMDPPASSSGSGDGAGAVFFNRGLAEWERNRQQWLTSSVAGVVLDRANNNNSSSNRSRSSRAGAARQTAHAIPLDVDEIIEILFASTRQLAKDALGATTGDGFGTGSSTPPREFPHPVPLPQMVDILQDLWEAEGVDL